MTIKQICCLDRSGYALSPLILRYLRKLLRGNSPSCICESGSGLSTLVFASYCCESGSKLVSLETDEQYMQQTHEWLRIHKLKTECVKLTQVRRVDDYRVFEYVNLPNMQVDFLLIDGPSRQTFGRTGVLFSLWKYLVEGALIVLDDINHNSEKKNLRLWKKHFPELTVVSKERFQKREIAVCRKL